MSPLPSNYSTLTLLQQDQMNLAARNDGRNKSEGSKSVREKEMRYNQTTQANSGFLYQGPRT